MTDTYNAVNGQLYSSFNPTTAFTTIGSQNNSPVSISQTSGATEDLLFQAGDAVTTDGSDSWGSPATGHATGRRLLRR